MDGFKRPPRRPTMSDIRRPVAVRPTTQPLKPQPNMPQPSRPQPSVEPQQASTPKDTDSSSQGLAVKMRRFPLWMVICAAVLALIVIVIGATLWWYEAMTSPVDTHDTGVVKVEIDNGSSLGDIAMTLKSRGLIKSTSAFTLYAHLHGQQDTIKAGTCALSPSESVGTILGKLTAGCHDFRVVTFYPGATIETSHHAQEQAKKSGQAFRDLSVTASLRNAGYTDDEITSALDASYSGPLFAGRPAKAGIEGYVFGETYYVDTDATAEDVLNTAFDQMYKIVQRDDLVAKFKAEGLNLYQGITLASIVEKELDCEGKPTQARKDTCYGYQQEIAQVFLKRLHDGMQLGSDPTFIYGADLLGVEASVGVDSPYNTRLHTGLPPGPISSPGELALKAVANPSKTDYLYFVAGDNGLIYFGKTLSEHEANIRKYCSLACSEV